VVNCAYHAQMCALPLSGFLVRLLALDCPPVCRFDAGVCSMHCELHINDLTLLALGVCFSVVKDVGFMLGFQFVSVVRFVCCDHESTTKYVGFLVSLSVEPLAFRQLRFF
jgi:hypothetical protein